MGAAVKTMHGKIKPRASNGPPRHKVKSPIDKAKGYEVVWQQVSKIFDVARAYQVDSWVYFIGEEADGPVKIGLSKDPIARLRGMQTGNPRRLRIEYVLIGDMALEKLLHELWEPFAISSSGKRDKIDAPPRTEWFNGEARETLCPIIETAVAQQVERLWQMKDATNDEWERIVRDAHAAHGFVAKGRDEIRYLARHVGYAVPRPSRI